MRKIIKAASECLPQISRLRKFKSPQHMQRHISRSLEEAFGKPGETISHFRQFSDRDDFKRKARHHLKKAFRKKS